MTNQYQEAWMATAAGRAVDPDGVGGLQCVDAAKDYFQAIFGVGWKRGWPGAGNAKDMLYTYDPEYFDRIINDPNNPNLIPQRGDIIIWGGNGVNPYGHIAVVLGANAQGADCLQQDGGLQVPIFRGFLGYWLAGAGTCTGWLRPKFDAPAGNGGAAPQSGAITPIASKPNQRVLGPTEAKQRAAANTDAAVVRVIQPASAGGTGIEEFTGFVHGQRVKIGAVDTDIWYCDSDGYVWSGMFTSQDTAGLPDLTPKAQPLQGYQRQVGEDGATRRVAPDKNANAVDTFDPGAVIDFKGFVRGTDPYGKGNNVWFVGRYTGGYIWSGVFTDSGTHDLPDITETKPATPPVTPPVPATYDFELDFKVIEGIVVEKLPASITNVDTGNFPARPGNAVWHWWNRPEANPSVAGVISQFQKYNSFVSAHFIVTADRIIQMVSLKDRAYHATASNGWYGIEVDPRAMIPGPQADKIWANLRALRRALEQRDGAPLANWLHKDSPGNVGKTECSQLDLSLLKDPVVVTPPPVDPPADPPVVTPPVTPPAIDEASVLRKFFEWLINMFVNRKDK